MALHSAVILKDFLDDRGCKTIHQSVLNLEESWTHYNNRLSLGSGRELIDSNGAYEERCLKNNPIVFEKFPSLLYKIQKALTMLYVDKPEFNNTTSTPGFEIIDEDGTYYNLGLNAQFYFTVPIHIGNSHCGLFYINKINNKKEYFPLHEGYFYFHTKPLHKRYEKLSPENTLICLEGKGAVDKNNKITLFF